MKVSSVIIGLMLSMSVAHADSPATTLSLVGEIASATGLEAGRDGESCVLNLQKTGRKEARFFYGIGEELEIVGSVATNAKRAFTDYVYMGPQISIGNHRVRQEEVIVDIKLGGRKAVLTRRMLEMDPGNVFTYTQRSEVKCEFQLKQSEAEEVRAETDSVE